MPGSLRIDDAEALLRYAVDAQLAVVNAPHGYSKARIARYMGRNPGWITTGLKTKPLKNDFLLDLGDALMALDPKLGRTGGLVSIAVRLRDLDAVQHLTARVPASWRGHYRQRERPAPDEFDVLGAASALLSETQVVPRYVRPAAADVPREQFATMIKRLILIAGSPPTPRNFEAQIVLGALSRHRFADISGHLQDSLTGHPLGFRTWRVITALVKMIGRDAPDEIIFWVREQLEKAPQLRLTSIHPARSLDLELAIAIPFEWTLHDGHDWAAAALIARMDDPDATVRERGTAAAGLWERVISDAKRRKQEHDVAVKALAEAQRAVDGATTRNKGDKEKQLRAAQDELARAEEQLAASPGRVAEARERLEDVVTRFRKEAQDKERESEDDVARGLRWIAATLHPTLQFDDLDAATAVSTAWPEGVDEGCRRAVDDASTRGLSNKIQVDTEKQEKALAEIKPRMGILFQHALLQNAGVYRRQAIDVLTAGGITSPLVYALRYLLVHPDAESWLRCRALFCLGFLQDRRELTADVLIEATKAAMDRMKKSSPVRGVVSEVHAAFSAAGDCFGVEDPDDPRVRERTRKLCQELYPSVQRVFELSITSSSKRAMYFRPSRAAAYFVTVTAHADPVGSRALLTSLKDHPDPVTRMFADGLGRFAGDDRVLPLYLTERWKPPA